LVKSLAELHGGSVDCQSPGPGQGSVFSISLPAISEIESSDSTGSRDSSDPAEVLAADHRDQLPDLEPATSRLQVLVVDDNVDAAQMLGSYLEEMGYGVVIENGALAALDRARRLRPEVCLFDIGLPGMDGLELARRIRAQPETMDCVLIAITGYGSEGDSKAITDAGFSHHFVKPVDGVALVALLGALQRRD
jgi:CheY-like chemotaxis protein